MKIFMWILFVLNAAVAAADVFTGNVDWSTALSFLAAFMLWYALNLDTPPLDK